MREPSNDATTSQWQVYADELQQRGDPRGELIALGADRERQAAYVGTHAVALLGTAAPMLTTLTLEWTGCFVTAAKVDGTNDNHFGEVLEAFAREPVFARLQSLALVPFNGGKGGTVDLGPIMSLLGGLPQLTGLSLFDARARAAQMLTSRDFTPPDNLAAFGDLAPAWALPNLASLHLSVADLRQLDFAPLRSNTLKALKVDSLRFGEGDFGDGNQACPFVVALAQAELPALERLELRLCETWVANEPLEEQVYLAQYPNGSDGGDNEGTNWADELEGVLPRLRATKLRHLGLTSFDSGRSVVDLLVAAGLPPSLQVLDLSDSTFSADTAKAVHEHASTFRGLQQLVLERTPLSAEDARALEAVVLRVVHSRRQPPQYLEAAPSFRYVVGME
jgi:hypothetical protein